MYLLPLAINHPLLYEGHFYTFLLTSDGIQPSVTVWFRCYLDTIKPSVLGPANTSLTSQ